MNVLLRPACHFTIARHQAYGGSKGLFGFKKNHLTPKILAGLLQSAFQTPNSPRFYPGFVRRKHGPVHAKLAFPCFTDTLPLKDVSRNQKCLLPAYTNHGSVILLQSLTLLSEISERKPLSRPRSQEAINMTSTDQCFSRKSNQVATSAFQLFILFQTEQNLEAIFFFQNTILKKTKTKNTPKPNHQIFMKTSL